MNTVRVRFLRPGRGEILSVELPRETRFSELTPLLCGKGCLEPQKPGYRYIFQEHMCGMNHSLEDYLPAGAAELELEVFQFPAILV